MAFFVSDRWSLIGRGSYMNFPSPGDDRVPSQDHNPSTHKQLRQPANEHGYITTTDISPHSVKIPNPTDRPISDWLRVVYFRASSTRGR